MTRTTPPRPGDVAAVLPQLAPLARTATRLHPRPGSPSARDSSVGGPLPWPADEPWPDCGGGPRFTPEESAVLARINEGRPSPAGPLAMLPVAQLYVRDIPLLQAPGQA